MFNCKNNTIISRSYNTKYSTNIPINHAEILSIINSCKILNSLYLDNCSMFISLEPCTMCTGAIIESRIKNIFIGSSNPFNGFFSKNYYNHLPNLNITWLNDTTSEFLINKFFIKTNKAIMQIIALTINPNPQSLYTIFSYILNNK